jgi:TonB-dependent receptor
MKLVTASALATVLAATAQAARLEGRVSDSSGSRYLGSAIVVIKELNLRTRTGSDGRYSFPNVPTGDYTLIVDYVGAQTVTQRVSITSDKVVSNVTVGEDLPPIENVLVYGQFAQQANAINQQRAADNITSVITADDAGALPDANIAEALQRAPGVFIQRDQGEGRFVGIRGLEPSLNTVKINGVNVAAPDSDQRATALDVIPSDLLENLKISKSFTPEMDGDSIGGTIEVESLSGFDRDEQYFVFGAEGGYNELVEEWSPKLNATYSDVFEIGPGDGVAIAASLSWQDREFGSYNLEHDGGWQAAESNGNLFPEEPELRDYQITRERLGFAFNMDWRPSDGNEYYLRTLYSDFEDDEIRNRIEIEPDEDSGDIGTSSAMFEEAEYTRSLKDRLETQEIVSLVVGGLNQRGNWQFEYSLGYSFAEEDEPNRHDTDFAGADDYSLMYSGLGDVPGYVLAPEAYVAENFELDEIVVENNLVEDEELSLTLDVTHQTRFFSAPGELKFGAKVRQRDKERTSDIDVYDDFGDETFTAADFLGGKPGYDLLDFGFGLNRGAIRSFTRGLGEDNLNGDESLVESTVGDYDIEEDIYAGYLMATVDFYSNLTIIGGVRYELTEFESSGAIGTVYESETDDIEENGFGTTRQDGDYDYFLPGVVVRWDLGDDVVLRAAGSQTIARPSFGSINPSSLAEIEESDGDTELQIEDLGNPDLDPFESINLDFSAEYYPEGDIGVLSAGLFYKDIDNYIAQSNVADSIDLTPWTSLVGLTPADITDADVLQFVNGEDAEVLGIELSWYTHFGSGFLLGLNGTFTDTEATFDGRDVDLPGSSSEIGNLVLGYENYGIQARVAVNYKSEALIVVGGDSSEDVYEDEHTQIDASLKYNITDSIQVYFEGINLTDEPFFAYQDKSRYNWQYEEYGRTYLLGVRVTNF